MLRAFPDTPINIEIKGRTKEEEASEYVYNAEVLARELARTKRNDLIVVSFQQPAVDRFHELTPRVGVAPGVTGVAGWVLDGTAPASGTVAFQLPVTFQFGQDLLNVTTAENVGRAHGEGYAVHTWFSGDDVDGPETWPTLVDGCVDGIMTSHPSSWNARSSRTGRPRPAPRVSR